MLNIFLGQHLVQRENALIYDVSAGSDGLLHFPMGQTDDQAKVLFFRKWLAFTEITSLLGTS